jgi:hypothetical protein
MRYAKARGPLNLPVLTKKAAAATVTCSGWLLRDPEGTATRRAAGMLRTLSVDRTSTRARECNTTTKKNLDAIVALLPIEVGRRADTGLAADVGHRHPSLPCFRMNASCASENLDAFIVFRSSQPGNQTRKTLAKNGPVYWEQINDPLTANYCLNNDGPQLDAPPATRPVTHP